MIITPGRRFWALVLGLLVIGCLVRLVASRGELWLDELWSLELVRRVTGPWQIFTSLHDENNHHLMTLWIWAWGTTRGSFVYRIPSIVAGTGAIAAAARIGRRDSHAAGLVAALLTALSYLLVLYSSESRGYAVACCMGLIAYDRLEAYLKDRGPFALLGYGLAVIVGLLGTLTYLNVAIALALWSAAVLLWQEHSAKSARQFVLLHVAPVTAAAVLWVLDVGKMHSGGGARLGLWAVLRETTSNALGFPTESSLGDLMVVACVVFTVWQIVKLARAGDLRWVFYAGAILVVPAAVLLATRRVFVYPRYFLTSVTFFYMVAAMAWGRLWAAANRSARLILVASLGAWCAGNAALDLELCRIGRGHFREAIDLIVAETPTGRPQIGSTFDFRSRLLFEQYSRHLPASRRPVMVVNDGIARVRPEWILTTYSPYELRELPPTWTVSGDLTYTKIREFPAVRLSGFSAGVYRRNE